MKIWLVFKGDDCVEAYNNIAKEDLSYIHGGTWHIRCQEFKQEVWQRVDIKWIKYDRLMDETYIIWPKLECE